MIQAVSYKQVLLSHRYGTSADSPVVLGAGPARVFSSGKDGGTSATGSWAKRGTPTSLPTWIPADTR